MKSFELSLGVSDGLSFAYESLLELCSIEGNVFVNDGFDPDAMFNALN